MNYFERQRMLREERAKLAGIAAHILAEDGIDLALCEYRAVTGIALEPDEEAALRRAARMWEEHE